MKTKMIIGLATSLALAGCTGGENAEDNGASIDDSEPAVTAPIGGDMPGTETDYNPNDDGGTLATDGM